MLKHVEYSRHGITEPLAILYIYKKVEDGKVIGALKIQIYRNMAIAVYESDKLEGGEVVDISPIDPQSIVKLISKYYEPTRDDIVIYGEKRILDEILNDLYQYIDI